VIQNHRSERPAVADLFPEDQLVLGWKRQGDQLDQRNRELRQQLTEHRKQLKLTKIDESEEIRQKLAAICGEREGLEAEFQRKEKKIYRVRELRVVHQAEVDRISEQIRESEAKKPHSADYLPESPKAKAWQKHHDSLLGLLREAITRRDESQQGCPDTLEVMKIAERIHYLKRAERNLLDRLEGAEPGPRGGVSFVR
jgi:chromosome segregation ATPase